MAQMRQSYDFVVDNYSIDLLHEIGRGQFGTLYKGVNNNDRSLTAVKKINYKVESASTNDVLYQMGANELEIFRKLTGHMNVVQLIHSHNDGENFWLFLEFCDKGNLSEYLQKEKPIMISKVKIMCECASAISFMHSFTPPLVHRDIKPENVLMKRERNRDIVKVTDFGVGKMYETQKDRPLQLTMNTLAGSLFYMAPEFFAADGKILKYQPTVDTFSLGLLFYVVLMFKDDQEELRPLSVAMQSAKQDQPYGLETANAMSRKEKLPSLFTDIDDGSSEIIQLKKIIVSMTASEEKDRMNIHIVMNELMHLHCHLLYTEIDSMKSGQVKSQINKEQQSRYLQDICSICSCPPSKPKTLSLCKHEFCTECIDGCFKINPICPVCKTVYGETIGNQPQGAQMTVRKEPSKAISGYPNCGAITIYYSVPSGIQTEDMPNPGQHYSGTQRMTYLPDNIEGNKILQLLQRAFDCRLIFTVGTSKTRGTKNTVIWNGIPHKSHPNGGFESYGFPDPSYINRVTDALAAKGIRQTTAPYKN